MTRPLSLLVAATLLACGVSACGEEDPFEAYCAEVEAQQTRLTEVLVAGDQTALLEALPTFEKLEARAPDDLRDEWGTITSRLSDLQQALEAAGADPATYDRRNPPEGVDAEERKAIDAAARSLTTPEMQAALEGVQQQARDVCQTPLFL